MCARTFKVRSVLRRPHQVPAPLPLDSLLAGSTGAARRGSRPACGELKIFGAALQAGGETRSHSAGLDVALDVANGLSALLLSCENGLLNGNHRQ